MEVNKPPLVSIIIPLYNAELYIEETLKTALDQDYSNFEIIIVNDGSSDHSLEIVQSHVSNNIKIYNQLNKGASSARNLGIKKSRGKYIQFLDADDLIPKNKISQQVSILENGKENYLIGCKWQRFKESRDHVIGDSMPINQTNEVNIVDKIDWLISRPMMIPHTWLVNRLLIEKAGLWNENLSLNDDGDFFYRIINASAGVIINNNIVLYRSFNNDSLSSKSDKKSMISWIYSAKTYKNIMQKIGTENAFKSSDQFFFDISFACLNKYHDLYLICLNEIFYTDHNYLTNIKFVDQLSPFIGLSNAKKLKDIEFYVRNNRFSRFIMTFLK